MSARKNLQIKDLSDSKWDSITEVADEELRTVAGSLRRLSAVSTCHVSGGYDCD